MSQNDFSIANADGATVRLDINSALQAGVTLSSGATSPTVTYAGMHWWDQTANLIKQRNGANTAWITVASFDGTTFIPYRSGVDASVIGKQTIFVPAGAMRPTVSNGCAFLAQLETTAGRPDLQVLDFDATADEHAQFQVAFPKSWDGGTVTFRAFWTTAGAVTTGVAVALQAVAVSDDDTIDVAYGTAVVVTDDALNAAEDLMVTAESSAVTVAGTPAEADMVFFRVFRDVSDANDDMTQDMRLIGIQLLYTIDAGTDA